MTDDPLPRLLERARELLAKANQRDLGGRADPARRSAICGFGSAIGRLGRWVGLHPERRGELDSFLAETAPQLDAMTLGWWIQLVDLYAQPNDLERAALQRALEARSDLQFFVDLYRGTAAGSLVAHAEEDVTAIDEALAETADATGRLPEVPPEIPPHHVWWRWPE